MKFRWEFPGQRRGDSRQECNQERQEDRVVQRPSPSSRRPDPPHLKDIFDSMRKGYNRSQGVVLHFQIWLVVTARRAV